jgi:hypothetical protein
VLKSAFLVCGISGLSVPSRAEAPQTGVTIGGQPIAGQQVKIALGECHKNAAHLAAADCLDRYWVVRWLLDAEASARKLVAAEPVVAKRRRILSSRVLETFAERAREPSPEEIDSYLKKHERDFVKPLRVRIFRILVSTEEKAQEISGDLRPTTTIAEFRALARDHSIDRATNERGGDLGFVWPDGSTDMPQVSADPALYAAAVELADGEFSRAPIPEGKHFAVVWRRGSLPAEADDKSARSLVRLRLLEADAERRTASLLTQLAKEVAGRNDELLGKLRRPEATLFREP